MTRVLKARSLRRVAVSYSLGMDIGDGTYTLGPATGRLLVKTSRTGVGSKAGHDLTIEVTRWEGTAILDTGQPASSSVNLDAEVDSFEVIEGTGGVKPLTDSDRRDIHKTLRERILHSAQHPSISFRSSRVRGDAESFTIDGDLTIAGVTQPASLQGRIADGRARGNASVVQSRWGIKPYTAFFGALKLADEVVVEFDIALG